MKKALLLMSCFVLCAVAPSTAQRHKKPVKKSTAKPSSDKGQKTGKADGARFKFTDGDTYDFKKIPAGPDATHDFAFVNTGNQPLIIQDAQPSCSCTVPDWPKHPILPGARGVIKVAYHATKLGPFTKEVFIQSNAILGEGEKRYTIYIKGTVDENMTAPPEKKGN